MPGAKPYLILLAILVVLPFHPTAQTAGDSSCPIYLLKRAGPALEIEKISLAAGGVRVFPVNSTSPNLDLVLPVGPGQSGNLVQTSENYLLVARCLGAEIRLQVRRPGGSTRDLPAIKTADLASYSIRVSVLGGDGSRRAFLIQGDQPIEADDQGPIVDMFQGQVPLKPGDYAISTDTAVRRATPSIEGEVALAYRQGWLLARARIPGRPEGDFVLDTASARTVVTKSFLPGNTEVHPGVAHEYSSLGARAVEQKATGAGGTIETFLGYADLPELQVGGTRFPAVTVGVLADPVASGEEPIPGILGMDLLQRADVVSFSYPRPSSSQLSAVFGRHSTLSGKGVTELPFFLVAGHIFVRAEVNGTIAYFVLDTGARDSFVTPAAASAAGFERDARPAKQVRGADNRPISAQPATLRRLRLGSAEFQDVAVNIADLPVLRNFGVKELAGVLGNSFLSRFGRVEIDFGKHVVRLLR